MLTMKQEDGSEVSSKVYRVQIWHSPEKSVHRSNETVKEQEAALVSWAAGQNGLVVCDMRKRVHANQSQYALAGF